MIRIETNYILVHKPGFARRGATAEVVSSWKDNFCGEKGVEGSETIVKRSPSSSSSSEASQFLSTKSKFTSNAT
jgi:hypothetical protein